MKEKATIFQGLVKANLNEFFNGIDHCFNKISRHSILGLLHTKSYPKESKKVFRQQLVTIPELSCTWIQFYLNTTTAFYHMFFLL